MKRTSSKAGFTLIELMIVVAIIAIIAAVAIPKLISARVSANENAAIATLRSIAAAQQQLQASSAIDTDADGGGEYGYFGELAGADPVRVYNSGTPQEGAAADLLDPTYLPVQFGNVVANQAVAFDSDMVTRDAADAAEGLLDGTVRTTNGSGQASASLSRTSSLTGMEFVTFCVDDAADGCLAGSDTAEKTADIFWVTADAGTADTGGAVRSTLGANNELSIEVADTPNDVLIVRHGGASNNTYTKVSYDANDQYRDNPSLGPISMADFETLATAAGCTVLTGYQCTWDWNLGNYDYNAVAINGTGGVSQFDSP